jgi:hypothetical protein
MEEESFVGGMDLVVEAGGVWYRVRHGWGRRVAYGRDRA